MAPNHAKNTPTSKMVACGVTRLARGGLIRSRWFVNIALLLVSEQNKRELGIDSPKPTCLGIRPPGSRVRAEHSRTVYPGHLHRYTPRYRKAWPMSTKTPSKHTHDAPAFSGSRGTYHVQRCAKLVRDKPIRRQNSVLHSPIAAKVPTVSKSSEFQCAHHPNGDATVPLHPKASLRLTNAENCYAETCF